MASMRKDYFLHEKDKYRIRGERTNQTFRLGDEVTVKLTKANLEDKQLDFELA